MKYTRYIRQTRLKDFGMAAQQKLGEARVLVVGVGGLGIPALQYLNAMGVGTLGLVESDIVELSNLQRQVLFTENDLGSPKLGAALEKLRAQNSETLFKTFNCYLNPENALDIISRFDVVVDATDNFATRYLINDACVILKKPFVYGALHGFEGQVCVFNFDGGPTYRCLFPKIPTGAEIPDCNENGVLGVIPGIIGNLQALEVVKLVTGVGEVLSGNLLLFNGLDQSFQKIRLQLRPENRNISKLLQNYETEICGDVPTITSSELKKLIASGKPIQLIDVRSHTEFETGHLDASVNIPLDQLEDRKKEVNANLPVFLLCQSGKRSKEAWEKLRKDFKKTPICSVAGGINSFRLIR
ncbi:HesA/MoeB/ThiF family protein [Flavobacteriaceae bacterium F89]|uniref:Molybdopterin-synthase adenylyltransferase n=1 Tax=Cerina litoralis TaxID=2874477 RepID=A0AAE3ESR1_9FLAO|nr:HesA/MoeB/ThiF family protein [Cerina litoralis]MCG2460400.1 HesA/MoeB/ThiF family protein [Cerina litoralis]